MLTVKYIPKTFDDVLIDKHIIDIVKSPMNILLYGPAGTGKTTIVRTLTQETNAQFLVLNISEDRGINLIREDVMNFVNIDINNKIIILDEMDSLTADAQNMLNMIMDIYYYDKNIKFIFVCNYINNINQSIISKCCCLRINSIKKELLIDRIKFIICQERMYLSQRSIEYIIDFYQNDIRKILNALETIRSTYGNRLIIGLDCIKRLIE